MSTAGTFDSPGYGVDTWGTRPAKERIEKLEREIEDLKRMLLSQPYEGGCSHTFPIWMVVPAGGCYINCPVCGTSRWVNGPSVTW